MMRRFTLLVVCSLLVNCSLLLSKTITSAPSGGNWRDKDTWLEKQVPTQDDDVIINSTIYCPGQSYSVANHYAKNLTISTNGKIIKEANSSGMSTLTISGNLVNDGEIIDNSDYFDVSIAGNFENNGIMKPRTIVMDGGNSEIRTSMAINSKNFWVNTTNPLKAMTDLLFTDTRISSSSNPRQTLDLNGFDYILNSTNLTYDGYYNTFNTNSHSSVALKSTSSNIILNNSILTGEVRSNIEITSNSHAILGDLEVFGDVTIAQDASVLSRKHLMNFIIRGDFYNYGSLSRDTITIEEEKISPLRFKVSVFGNTHNLSYSGISDFYIHAENEHRYIEGNFGGKVTITNIETQEPGGLIELVGDMHIDDMLYIYSHFLVAEGKTLYLDKKYSSSLHFNNNGSEFQIEGDLLRYHFVNNNWGYNTFNDPDYSGIYIQMRDWDGDYQGNFIQTNTNSYPGLEGGINKWWRVEPEGDIITYQYVLKLYYDDADLNGIPEEDLHVFRTTDKGDSWELISFGEFVSHNKDDNYFEIGDWSKPGSHLTAFGDFVIGSIEAGVPLESPVCLDFTGRNDVRVGAPNIFTITMYNASKKQTSPFIVCFANTDRIIFTGVEIPGNDGIEYLPIDSIGNKEDALVFVVPYLDPLEQYSFDVIAEGTPEGGIISDATLAGGQSLSLFGFGKFLADDKKDDAIADAFREVAELNDEEAKEYARGMNLTVRQLNMKKKKDGFGVSTAKNAIKYTVENISKSNPITDVIYKIGSTVEFVHKISDSYRRRIWYWLYKETGLYDSKDKSHPFGGKSKNTKLVTSWDPNAIAGPVGYSDNNFVQNLDIVNYKIFFENKAEAAAAAYKIEILDTLDESVFDLSTVSFGRKSHEGDNYNWQIEKKGNVLRWYIEGIELPPNKVPPQGEGWVDFSVKLKESVGTGTEIKNRASIIFDLNDPIMTNTWVNIIDDAAPGSQISPISYTHGESKLTFQVNGSDNKSGSGIGKYLIYASINNTPYKVVGESYTDEVEYEFELGRDTLFRFYTIAYDNVDNMQQEISNIQEINLNSTSVLEVEELDIDLVGLPNPVKDVLNILISKAAGMQGIVRISDILGNKVFEREIILHSNMETITIPFDKMFHGAYIVDVIISGKTKTIKVVK